MSLEDAARKLAQRVRPGLSATDIRLCTNFAIDANAASRPDLTIGLMTALARQAPREARVWQLLGLAYRLEQDSAAALAALEKAAGLAPHDRKIASAVATTAFEAGLPAVSRFERACALAPGDGELILSHAAALAAQGDGAAAIARIQPLVRAHPEWVRGHEALSNWLWTMGAVDRFTASFGIASKVRPRDMALRFAWFRALTAARRWDEAHKVLEEGRRILGPHPQFDWAEAAMRTERGDDEGAEALFSRLDGVDDPGTILSQVRHGIRTGRIDRAEAVAAPLLRGPYAPMVWPYLSILWRLRGDRRAEWLDGAPPFIRSFDLPFAPGELAALAACLRRLHQARHHPVEQSLRGGTQTDGPLFARIEPEIRAARAMVLAAVRDYVDALPGHDGAHPLLSAPRGRLAFAGAWSVRLLDQGFHVGHTHPLGWISSALYIVVPDAADRGAAPSGWLQLGAPPADLRVDLPAYCQIEPRPGRLVLFPSTMWHGTEPFRQGERMTIAFDMARPVG